MIGVVHSVSWELAQKIAKSELGLSTAFPGPVNGFQSYTIHPLHFFFNVSFIQHSLIIALFWINLQ